MNSKYFWKKSLESEAYHYWKERSPAIICLGFQWFPAIPGPFRNWTTHARLLSKFKPGLIVENWSWSLGFLFYHVCPFMRTPNTTRKPPWDNMWYVRYINTHWLIDWLIDSFIHSLQRSNVYLLYTRVFCWKIHHSKSSYNTTSGTWVD